MVPWQPGQGVPLLVQFFGNHCYRWFVDERMTTVSLRNQDHLSFIVFCSSTENAVIHADTVTSAPLADQQSRQIHVAWRAIMHSSLWWGGFLSMPLQLRTLSSDTHIWAQKHTDEHSPYENERVRLAAKAGLARGLMMPGMRLLSTTMG